jgi:hypothetical protein
MWKVWKTYPQEMWINTGKDELSPINSGANVDNVENLSTGNVDKHRKR